MHMACMYTYTYTYVTEFIKRGLPHTSILPTLTMLNFRLVKAIDLKYVQSAGNTNIA